MQYEIFIAIGFAFFGSLITVAVLKDWRRAFLVPEGYVGLLYHKGKFVEALRAGMSSPASNTEESGAS